MDLEYVENRPALYMRDLTTALGAQCKIHDYLVESFHEIETLQADLRRFREVHHLPAETPGGFPRANSRLPLTPWLQMFPFPSHPTAGQIQDYMYEFMLDCQHEIWQRQSLPQLSDLATKSCKRILNTFRYLHHHQVLRRLEIFIARGSTETAIQDDQVGDDHIS
jgi:hypothetical protein